jgi:uncharacterized protein YdeI (YjbR/CyaY-like superfamily)
MMIPTAEQLYFTQPARWRSWLKENHASNKGVWLVFHHAKAQRPGINYLQALEEALCYGWIDSTIRNGGPRKYLRKFTPRVDCNKWSPSNLAHLKRLIKRQRMTKAGLAKVGPAVLARLKNGERPKERALAVELPGFMASALKQNPKAGEFFFKLAPSYQKLYLRWITGAVKKETKLRRLVEAVGLMNKGQKLGMK